MCHTGNKLICCKLFQSFHTDIAESVECEMWTEDLRFSVADKCVDGFCLAKCLRVKVSVFIQNLCMTDHDLLTFLAFHMQLNNTCDDLSEINQSLTLWCHDQLFAGNLL